MSEDKLKFFRFLRLNKSEKQQFTEYYSFCKKNEKSNDDYYSFGYETFGIILYKFCSWMINDLQNQKISRVLFFSRDGYIIQQAFNRIPGHEKFDQDYCYVSRRSLRVPTLWYGQEDKYTAILPTRYITIEDLLSSVGVDADNVRPIMDKYGFNAKDLVKGEEIKSNNKLSLMIEELWKPIVENSKKEYKNAIDYFESLALDGSVAVVDIGWRGTMQMYLDKLLCKMGKKVRLRGYYAAINSDHIRGYDMHGYVGNMDGESKGSDNLRGYIGLIETLFLRTEGSTNSYGRDSQNRMVPILEKYEYMDGGKLSFEAESVLRIQNGALQFVEDYVKSGESFLDSFSDTLAFHNLDEFAKYPKLSDVRMFCDFRFFNNGTTSYLAKTKSLIYYIFHMKCLKNDFYGSRWRIGFMKNLLKIKIPYNKLMNLLMIIVKKSK